MFRNTWDYYKSLTCLPTSQISVNHGLLKRVGQILPVREPQETTELQKLLSGWPRKHLGISSWPCLRFSIRNFIHRKPTRHEIMKTSEKPVGQSSHLGTETPICYELSSLRLCSKRQDFQPCVMLLSDSFFQACCMLQIHHGTPKWCGSSLWSQALTVS